MSKNKTQRKIKWNILTWAVSAVLAVVFYFAVTGFSAFPSKYKLPVLAILAVLIALTGIFSFRAKKGGKTVITVINVILSVCLAAGSIYVPYLDGKMKKIFTSVSGSRDLVINVYAFTEEYKADHPEVVINGRTSTPTDIAEYKGAGLIVQSAVDQENQEYALNQLEEENSGLNLDKIRTEDIASAVDAFYAGDGELLMMSANYESSITNIEEYSSFATDTVIVASVSRKIEVKEEEKPEVVKDITNTPFTVYIAGSDTRYYNLTYYGRTDVNILLTVNPNTKQMLITGIPRDAYIPNPALGYGYDKLTHLGNDGLYNTMQGISDYFGIDVDYYVSVNFITFKNIIDAVGGVDIYNPYAFSNTDQGAGYSSQAYYFPEGDIHLTGDSGLAYVRERYALPDGDYGRNEHQTIVLKALLSKLTSSEILSYYGDVLSALEGQFLTDMAPEVIYQLAGSQVDSAGSWQMISYHIGGEGAMQGTASMGWDRPLYVVNLFDSQVYFIQDQINKVMNDEVIEQTELPDAGDTTYIPN